MSKSNRSQRPLDQILERIRVHHALYRPAEQLDRWEGICVNCWSPEWGLTLIEHTHGGVTARCSAGCTEEQIVAALQADPVDERVDSALGRAEEASRIAAAALDLARDAHAELALLQHHLDVGLEEAA